MSDASASREEEQSTGARPGASGHNTERQAVLYCPYCAEETLFPIEDGGWECRSCQRAFSVKFLGLRTARSDPEQVSR